MSATTHDHYCSQCAHDDLIVDQRVCDDVMTLIRFLDGDPQRLAVLTDAAQHSPRLVMSIIAAARHADVAAAIRAAQDQP